MKYFLYEKFYSNLIIRKLNLKNKNINYKNNIKIKTALISLKIFIDC